MRRNRIKIHGRTACYHCMTRVVGGERLLDGQGKETITKQMWRQAEFCGVEVLTFCIMGNHIHLLVRIPSRQELSDTELVRRYGVLYGAKEGAVEQLAVLLQTKSHPADITRSRLKSRMGDVSVFMKELKQRFSIWFNHRHIRYGTMWAERFKSVLVEDSLQSLRMVAAYIDLNPVRAGLCTDPADYRFSGYGEAMAGISRSRLGILKVTGKSKWNAAVQSYRVLIFGKGLTSRDPEANLLRIKHAEKILRSGGKLTVSEALRCRVRYFTDGAILGSEAYVNGCMREFREQFSKLTRCDAQAIAGVDTSGLRVARKLRGTVIGL